MCGESDGGAIDKLTGKQLRALWAALGHEFTPSAWGKITGRYAVVMRRCPACGFVYFDPSLAGNEDFYRQLAQPNYFSSTRPEFTRTLEFANRHRLKRVLDVGCGDGAFLNLARNAGLETHGLELNSDAAAQARAKGHRVFDCHLTELVANESGEPFDLIAFFQVLEHVSNPVTVMKQAAMLLRAGGFISVAVPSAEGVYRLVPLDPHQWPPHHVSRWRKTDFRQLAQFAALRLIETGGDILAGTDIEYFWKLQSRLMPAVNRPPWPGRNTFGKMVSLVYRKTGMKHLFRHRGISLYGYFQQA
jgi:SAM-dependent methyltransferase